MNENEPRKYTRREFVKLAGVVGAGAAMLGGSMMLGKKILNKDESGVVLSDTAMSTVVSISIFGKDRKESERIAKLALSRMKTLEKGLTRFENSGEPAILNKNKELKNVSSDMKNVVETSMMVHRESEGAFDPSILPVLEAVKNGRNFSEAKELHKITGDDAYSFNGNTIKLKNNKVELTFDGVAKGFIVDEVVRTLVQNGVKNMLIYAGGDIQTVGKHPSGRPFVIGIQNPRGQGEIAQLKLNGRAVATSGDYERNYNSSFTKHHLIDPKTGDCANMVSSATVVAPNAMLADAWSTALFVLGADKGIKLLESIGEIDGFVVTKDGKSMKTSRFPLA